MLRCLVFALLGLGDRRKVVRAPALFEYPLGRLALAVQFPMPLGTGIGRIQDGMIKKWIILADIVASFLLIISAPYIKPRYARRQFKIFVPRSSPQWGRLRMRGSGVPGLEKAKAVVDDSTSEEAG